MTRAELDDERSFLLDSLEDLERERGAGDLSDTDYEVLRDRYTRRAAEVLRALDDGDDVAPDLQGAEARPDGAPGRARGATTTASDLVVPNEPPTRRRALLVGGLLAVVVAVAVAVVATQSGTRLPGQTATGSVSLSRAAQLRRTLAQAETLESEGDVSDAVPLFEEVLARDPTQPDALAQLGWLEYEAGVASRDPAVLAKAQQLEETALRAAPDAYAPHLYLGSMLLAEGDNTGAVAQYRQFLADAPPTAEVRAAQQFIDEAFKAVHQPVPALPGVTSSAPSTPPATSPSATSPSRTPPSG